MSQKALQHEKNISAVKKKTQKQTRFPRAYVFGQWPQGFGTQKS
jgi:hypothetical protein